MTTQNDKIYYGFFNNFKNADTLLFAGSSLAFAKFRDFLKNSANRGESVNFGEVSLFVKTNIDVTLNVLPQTAGMRKINDKLFEWGLAVKDCERFAKELENFASVKDGTGFHQYLECEGLDNVQVMVSIGEYESSLFNDI